MMEMKTKQQTIDTICLFKELAENDLAKMLAKGQQLTQIMKDCDLPCYDCKGYDLNCDGYIPSSEIYGSKRKWGTLRNYRCKENLNLLQTLYRIAIM